MNVILNQLKKEATILCPLCNKEYKPTNIKIVKNTENTILTHSNCPRCRGGIMSLLHQDVMGLTLIGVATDLDYQDVIKMKKNTIITDNDILDIFKQLNQISKK